MNQAERRVWLIKALLAERSDGQRIPIPANASEQRDLLRSLMNVRTSARGACGRNARHTRRLLAATPS